MSISIYTLEKKDQVLVGMHTREEGLTTVEAAQKLVVNGRNEIIAHPISWVTILIRQIKSPFIYMLIGAAVLAMALGEATDGIIIFIFVLVNTLVSFFQEYHSARSLLLLKRFINPRARVLRNGIDSIVEAATIVPGDLLIVETGDIICADVRFIDTTGLSINESVLTGESAPVQKNASPLAVTPASISDASNRGFSGTTVMGGRGIGVVVATGTQTEIGSIAQLTVETNHVSEFEKSIGMFARFIMKMVSIILVVLLVANLSLKLHDVTSNTGRLVELLFFAVALAISVIPEALPVVTTLSLSRGALQLAKQHVVVKRLSAVEDLGSIEVLCTDKTGTLTENHMTVSAIHAEDTLHTLKLAMLASGEVVRVGKEPTDSFDLALFQKMTQTEIETLASFERLSSVPFDPTRRRTAVVVQEKNSSSAQLIVRGAPETIIGLTTLTKEESEKILTWVESEGRTGRRTIAIAEGVSKNLKDPTKDEKKLTFVGCISFTDPIKSTTKAAIDQAENLGVRLVILTGDGPAVSGAVARDVDIITDPKDVITESEFLALSPSEQLKAVHKYNVFARMSPAGKYRVIELLSQDKIVGYLGDGINDAPALKMASVGLVVDNASDIARDAADVVLLNRSLSVIIDGIRLGRAVFENTVKYLKTTLISSFGNFYTIAIAQLLLPYLPMLPIQILLLNLLTDYPMLAIATDTVDPNDIRKPRRYNVRDIVFIAIVLGLVSTLFDFIVFATFRNSGELMLQTNWFIASVLTELVLLFSIRTHGKFWKARLASTPLLLLSGLSAFIAIILPFTSFGHTFFKFGTPSFGSVMTVILIVTLYFAISEIMKLAYYHFWNHVEEGILEGDHA